MRASMVGTTIALVTCSVRTVSSQTLGSKLRRNTSRRPAKRFDSRLATPATWYGGTATSTVSSGLALANSTVPSR